MGSRQAVTTGVKSVGEDAPEVEINEPRLRIEKKLPMGEHLFERSCPRFQLHAQTVLLFPPLLKAVTSEFSFLMAAIGKLLGLGNKFLKIGVVQFERDRLDIVVDIAPENVLDAVEMVREQIEMKTVIEILRDHLGIIVDFKHHILAVTQHGQLIITLPRQLPNEGTVAGLKIHQLMACA